MAPRKPPKQPAIAVEPRGDGRWAVQTDGTQRAAKIHERKQDAVDDARARAQSRGAELVVKNQDGRIAKKDSHGRESKAKG
jgi:hypothetical protein